NTVLLRLVSHARKLVIEFDSKYINAVKVGDTYTYSIDGDSNQPAMLESIIQKVFNYPLKDCSILSLLKCDSNSLNLEEEINACLPHLTWQLDNSTSKVIVVFGEILPKRLLNLSKEESFGRIVSLKTKHFLSTYALEDMLKNPTLKKEALAHFKIALQFLNQS
ncbi:uracil-DNA glycosylase family protein, partial [Helicobacter pylori]|nr:uracil-DNA glycosylase family protein [Helicobacter pylori]